jgi:Tol biopolymer transport system component
LPAAPELAATADYQAVYLSWSDNSNFEDGYEILRADWWCSGGMFYSIAVVPANTTTFVDGELYCGTEYFYQLRALKGSGSSAPSNEVDVIVPPPPVGSIEVTTATTGLELDPDGYFVTVDGMEQTAAALNGMLAFTEVIGDHSVALTGMAPNCVVDGTNPRTATVAEGIATRIDFAITCYPGGTLQVTSVTTGTDPDPDGYTVTVDGGPSATVAASGTTSISSLLPGNHVVQLTGVAANCDATSSNPQQFAIVAGDTTQVTFETACSPVTKLAFASGGIWSINSNGTGATFLHASSNAFQPAWSPDGSKIAFSDAKIYVMNADGSNPVQLTNTQLYELHPTWSPGGTRIAFCGTTAGGASDIYATNADGTNVVQLTTSGRDSAPAWSPDGGKIAFEHLDASGFSDIYVMNADGTGVTQLTDNGYVHDFNPAWSPDGTKIAFTSGYSPTYYVHVMNADGTNVVRVTTDEASEPTWSPDGRKIALDYHGGIWVVRADGSDPVQLTGGTNPAWRH